MGEQRTDRLKLKTRAIRHSKDTLKGVKHNPSVSMNEKAVSVPGFECRECGSRDVALSLEYS